MINDKYQELKKAVGIFTDIEMLQVGKLIGHKEY